jgi:7,8-dihydro-6-hydroxymethylpterin-pyrophosphokinase
MQEIEEVNIIDDRAKIVSLLTALQKQKLTLGQSFELERLLTKERNRAIQNRVTDLDIILGYYLIGLNGYV